MKLEGAELATEEWVKNKEQKELKAKMVSVQYWGLRKEGGREGEREGRRRGREGGREERDGRRRGRWLACKLKMVNAKKTQQVPGFLVLLNLGLI